MTDCFEVKEDIRYIQGRKFLDEQKFEDAINLFSSLVQTCNEVYGEMSVASAKAYYEYGNALLMKEEDNPTDDLIGPADKGRQTNKGTDEEGESENEGSDNEGEENNENGQGNDDEDEKENPGNGSGPQQAENEDDDLVVAWEVLDLARVILEKAEDSQQDKLLTNVLIRLGDLMRFNCKYENAIEEYNKALQVGSKCYSSNDRLLSNIHFHLAVSHIYNSSEKGTSNPLEQKKLSLEHYTASREILQAYIQHSTNRNSDLSLAAASSNDSSIFESVVSIDQTIVDLKEIVDELTETIEALSSEIQQEETAKKEESLVGTYAATTIGFGSSTSSAPIASGFGSSAFSAPIASSSSSSIPQHSTGEINTGLQIKKKQKTSHPGEESKKENH